MFDRYLSGRVPEMECVRAEFWWILRNHLFVEIVSAHTLLSNVTLMLKKNSDLYSPEGLREVFLTGGLPPLVNGPDPLYEKTYREWRLNITSRHGTDPIIEKVVERNEAYYQKFPEDAERVKRIIQYLQQNKPRLGAGVLTAERFQQIGITFGVHGASFS